MTADREAMLRALVAADWNMAHSEPPIESTWRQMYATMLAHPNEPDLWSWPIQRAVKQLAALEPLIAEREKLRARVADLEAALRAARERAFRIQHAVLPAVTYIEDRAADALGEAHDR